MRASLVGSLVLLGKLGPKLFPLMVKLQEALWSALKPIFGIKAAGLAGSVGLYTYLLTWEMGLALVTFIGIHEYGHLWAMKRCGIKTKGMFFLPGIGAVAVAEERFGSARNEAYIAIMGPIVGLLFFVFPVALAHKQTGENLYAAIAAFAAFINLLNLLPMNPLDGGRILKAIAYSKNAAASLIITVAVTIAAAVFGASAGLYLLVYMAGVGLYEIATDFGIRDRLYALGLTFLRGCAAFILYIVTGNLIEGWGSIPTLVAALGCLLVAFMLVSVVLDARHVTTKRGRPIYLYPYMLLVDIWIGVEELLALRREDIAPIENYAIMSLGGKAWYASAYLALVAIHAVVIYHLAQVPGAELAKELLE